MSGYVNFYAQDIPQTSWVSLSIEALSRRKERYRWPQPLAHQTPEVMLQHSTKDPHSNVSGGYKTE